VGTTVLCCWHMRGLPSGDRSQCCLTHVGTLGPEGSWEHPSVQAQGSGGYWCPYCWEVWFWLWLVRRTLEFWAQAWAPCSEQAGSESRACVAAQLWSYQAQKQRHPTNVSLTLV
jgi:hypothetical protein